VSIKNKNIFKKKFNHLEIAMLVRPCVGVLVNRAS
jgi:hypothetical protein